jgi:hypothetical protein
MATDIHALVEDADNFNSLLSLRVDDKVGSTGETEIAALGDSQGSASLSSGLKIFECFDDRHVIAVGLVFRPTLPRISPYAFKIPPRLR